MSSPVSKIRIVLESAVLTASVIDSVTARDFLRLLPLSLTLEDYAGTEKISNLPVKLTTTGAPPGTAAALGDIAYYSPWGNLAIFYKKFGYASGLIKLATIDADAVVLQRPGSLTARIEAITA